MESNQNGNLINKAIEFASKAHKNQFRKGTDVPYISHPLAVGMTLAKFYYPDDFIIAGILHDCVEDTDVTLERIEEQFGKKIADIVKGCSEPDKSDTWENRKKHTIKFLKTAPQDIKIVACADKLQNLQCIIADYDKYGETMWSRFNAGKDQQRWYYGSLVDSFNGNEPIFVCYRDNSTQFLAMTK